MTRKFPHVSSPITIGRTTFRNRIFSAPMGGTDITNDGCIGPKSTAFYELRAKGGAAAVTVSELMVHPQTDGSHAYHLDESILNSLAASTYTADAIRRHGAIPSLELSHSGQFAGTYMTDKSRQHGLCQWGPSEGIRPDGVPVKALTQELIDDIVKAYGHATGLAKRAGFEMVMIHGGHGWLINQFLSPLFNHRSDRYGGSLENRVRFAIEVLQSVRAAVGPFCPIEFRMSGAEFTEGGYDLEEGIQIAQAIEAYADIIHVSAGTYQKTFGITHPSMFEAHGRNVYLAAEIKKHVSKPVATIGGLTDPAMMEDIIASGKADIVYMARQLLWPIPKRRRKSWKAGTPTSSTACAVSPVWLNGRRLPRAAAPSIPSSAGNWTGRKSSRHRSKRKSSSPAPALVDCMQPIRQPAAVITSSSVKKKAKSAAS